MISDSSSPTTDKIVSLSILAIHCTSTYQLDHCSSPQSNSQSVLYSKAPEQRHTYHWRLERLWVLPQLFDGVSRILCSLN